MKSLKKFTELMDEDNTDEVNYMLVYISYQLSFPKTDVEILFLRNTSKWAKNGKIVQKARG